MYRGLALHRRHSEAACRPLTLVPAAGVLAALDIWLERQGPNLTGSFVLPNWSWIALLVFTAFVLVILGDRNASRGFALLESMQQSSSVQITLPQDLSGGQVVR